MADIDIRRAHPLGLEGARAAAERLAAQLGQRYGLVARWEGNVMHFERPGIEGSLALAEKELHLTVVLGLFLKAMKGPLRESVARELDTLFASPKTDPRPR